MGRFRSASIVIGALLLLTLLHALFAKRESEPAGPKPGTAEGPAKTGGAPKRFDYYVLVLGWSPTYCANEGGKGGRDAECGGRARHGFILHGLWPAYAQGWPRDCGNGERVWVPQPVIDEMDGIMPSKSLVIHEYRSHGTCTGLSPERYFDAARALYGRVDIPPSLAAGGSAPSLSPEEIETVFITANAWLKRGMIEVTCRGRDLLDVRICFDRDLNPRDCGQNEARHACRASSVALSPSPSR